MKILGIVGPMRKNRNTKVLVERTITEIEALNQSTSSQILYTTDLKISPCRVVCSSYCIKHPYLPIIPGILSLDSKIPINLTTAKPKAR